MDQNDAKIIMAWISKNLVDCEDPYLHGKALQGCRNCGEGNTFLVIDSILPQKKSRNGFCKYTNLK